MAPCDINVQVNGLTGGIVKGKLGLIARSSVTVSRITVALRGSSISTFGDKQNQTEEHIIIDDSVSVSPNYTVMSTGEHDFPFSFSLPASTQCKSSNAQLHIHGPLPPTYASQYLQIQYRLTVTLHFKKNALFGSKLSKTLVIPLTPPQAIPPNMNKSTVIHTRFALPPLPQPAQSFISSLIFGQPEPLPERPILFEVRLSGVLQLGGSLPIDMSFVANGVTRMYLHKLTISVICTTSVRCKGKQRSFNSKVTLCDLICNERIMFTNGRAVVPRELYDSIVAGIEKSIKVCNAETSHKLLVQCEVAGLASESIRTVLVSKNVVVVEHELPSYEEVVGPQFKTAGILKTA